VLDKGLTAILRDVLDTDPERGVVLLGPDGAVLYANAAARNHLRDGTARGRDPHLPASIDRAIVTFLAQANAERGNTWLPPLTPGTQSHRGTASFEMHYPSETDRRFKVTLELLRRHQLQHVVVRVSPVTPWAEPTVRRLQSRFKLTLREAQVAVCVARGLTNSDIAQRLGIVEKTVKNVLVAVFSKCGVRNRVELALRSYDVPVAALLPTTDT
jgi:DNA-binding CsgD family transcriptional regulator